MTLFYHFTLEIKEKAKYIDYLFVCVDQMLGNPLV